MSGNKISSKLIGPTDGLSLHGRGVEAEMPVFKFLAKYDMIWFSLL